MAPVQVEVATLSQAARSPAPVGGITFATTNFEGVRKRVGPNVIAVRPVTALIFASLGVDHLRATPGAWSATGSEAMPIARDDPR